MLRTYLHRLQRYFIRTIKLRQEFFVDNYFWVLNEHLTQRHSIKKHIISSFHLRFLFTEILLLHLPVLTFNYFYNYQFNCMYLFLSLHILFQKNKFCVFCYFSNVVRKKIFWNYFKNDNRYKKQLLTVVSRFTQLQ